jgi:multidrug efflux pump subunit AcrB
LCPFRAVAAHGLRIQTSGCPSLGRRFETVFQASKQVRSATAFGEAIIIIVYLPNLALTGVEGKMFHPMALTVIFALFAAFVLSLTFIPAMVALCMAGKLKEKENFLIRVAESACEPLLRVSAPDVVAFDQDRTLCRPRTLNDADVVLHAAVSRSVPHLISRNCRTLREVNVV